MTQSTDLNVCTRNVSFTAPTYSDNCGGTLTRTSGYCNGCTYPLGDTAVDYVVSDVAGHTATCSFVVTVADSQAPTIGECRFLCSFVCLATVFFIQLLLSFILIDFLLYCVSLP